MEYIKNTETGEIFEGNKHLLEYAATQSHMILVDANGKKIDTDDDVKEPDEALKAENEQLKQEIYDLKTELELYRQRDREGQTVDEPGETVNQPTEANRIDALVNALSHMEKDNPDHFTTTGLPRVEVLEAFAQIPEVKSGERDEAWKRFNS